MSQKKINFILALNERWTQFKNFITHYENACLKTQENTRLVIVLFEHESNPELIADDEIEKGVKLKQSELINSIIKKLKLKYLKTVDDTSLSLVVQKGKYFSKTINLELGAEKFDNNELLFVIDVDMIFSRELLYRIRMNTVQNKQAYFPIVYNQYNPKYLANKNSSGEFELSYSTGHWRNAGYGMVGVYKSDWRSLGGYDTSIVGWGKEDVDFFEKAVSKKINLFRCVDPDLVHVYHEKYCDKDTPRDQYKMCKNAKADMYVPRRILSDLLYVQYLNKILNKKQKRH